MTAKFVGHLTSLQYFSFRNVEMMNRKAGLILSYLILLVCEVTLLNNEKLQEKPINRLGTTKNYGFGFTANPAVSVSSIAIISQIKLRLITK